MAYADEKNFGHVLYSKRGARLVAASGKKWNVTPKRGRALETGPARA